MGRAYLMNASRVKRKVNTITRIENESAADCCSAGHFLGTRIGDNDGDALKKRKILPSFVR